MNDKKKTVIIIAGPTASGKTALAVRLAKHFNTKIISADSRQCYRELNIGVAKPSPEQLQEVQHFFIDSHSIQDNVNASSFEQYALTVSEELFAENDRVVMVGGTGLYIKAFCEGLDDIPAIDPSIREEINTLYNEHGLPWLQLEVQKLDPWFWSQAEQQNPQRLMRALEVIMGTGESIMSFRSSATVQRPFDIIKFALDVPREDLYRNIEHRTDQMIRDGLLFEVRELENSKHLNALHTVGYTELFEHLEGKTDLPTAIQEIKKNTRHYAKRQVTWFKKDPNYQWIPPDISTEELANMIQEKSSG